MSHGSPTTIRMWRAYLPAQPAGTLSEQQYDEMVKAGRGPLKRGTDTAEAILKRYSSYNMKDTPHEVVRDSPKIFEH